MNQSIVTVECPRDAMQGWKPFIPTETKINYLNALLKVGFNVLDFGSFVSAQAIPQLADTKDVLKHLDLSQTSTKLLAIIANTRGAEEALQYPQIDYLGFPFSISETFQMRNTNKTIAQSVMQVAEIQRLCLQAKKQLVVYISMGFGNPYGDAYSPKVAIDWVAKLAEMGIKTIALADTIGVSNPENIKALFTKLIPTFSYIEFGAHFHSTPHSRQEKIAAAYQAGCRRFDTAINGIGGCPMAEDELVGNIATESLIDFCNANHIALNLNQSAFEEAAQIASSIFL
ncbi:MAG: hydroxymethylglutaryl-CoA lyase [Chitinophagia bacterium]|nr:hydroxymethylglutaryl-CoA lyase [Chitinophagia bacterium]